MVFHPTGRTVEVVGTEYRSTGRSCEEHDIFGSVLTEDIVGRFRMVQLVVEGKGASALAVYHFSDAINYFHVGFLQRHLLEHWKRYDRVLVQITEV